MSNTELVRKLLFAATLPALLAACSNEPAVSFSQDVNPILEKNCLSCHQSGGSGYEVSGLSMVSYDDLMNGTSAGPMVIGGDVEGSNLLVLMEGRADPSISMPHGAMDPVPASNIATIKLWVAQGAKNN